jgi:hypothetical protein
MTRLLTAIALGRTAVTVCASFANLTILTAEAVGRDVGLSSACAELGLAACTAVAVFATVSFRGTAIAILAAFANFAVLATKAVSGNISFGSTSSEVGLTTSSTEVIGLTAVSFSRTTVSKGTSFTGLAILPARPVS